MLTPKELITAGIKPGELFGKILRECTNIEQALAVWNARPLQANVNQVRMTEGSVWHWLCHSEFFKMCSKEVSGELASNSEKRRWLVNGSVRLNGQFPGLDDKLPEIRTDLVFFPTSQLRITML